MNIPGFTAENSFTQSNGIHRLSFSEQTNFISVIMPAAPVGRGRTDEQKKCDDKLGDCYIGCSVDYPESGDSLNPDRRQGCEDSCDASHRLCSPQRTTPRGRFGGFGTVMM